VKDIVVLNPGATIADIERFQTEAKSVTNLVVDLKTGLIGAPLRQADTLKRFGVTNLILRPFENVAIQRQQSLRVGGWAVRFPRLPQRPLVLGWSSRSVTICSIFERRRTLSQSDRGIHAYVSGRVN